MQALGIRSDTFDPNIGVCISDGYLNLGIGYKPTVACGYGVRYGSHEYA